MKIINYTYKFFISIIIGEINILKINIEYIKYLFLNVDLFKYFSYLLNKTTNPLKSKKFNKFLTLNKKKWKKINNYTKNKNETILVESFLNQQFCAISNMLIGKYLEILTNSKCVGFIRAGDIKGRLLFKSFGVEKIYEYKFGGFLIRSIYIFKAIRILYNIKNIKDLYNYKLNGIDVGLLSYDTWIRYTKIPSTDKIDIKLILFFSQALFASDFFDKFYRVTNIKKLVQAEKQFIPFSILFQKKFKK